MFRSSRKKKKNRRYRESENKIREETEERNRAFLDGDDAALPEGARILDAEVLKQIIHFGPKN